MFHNRKLYCISTVKLNTNSLENVLPKNISNIPDLSRRSSKIQRTFLKPFLALIYTLMTSVFFSLSSVFVKQLPYINPGELSLVRNIGVFVGSLPVVVYSVKEVFGSRKDRVMLTLAGFLIATAMYLNLTAYRYLPLAEAAIIMSAMPVTTAVLARIYLKEACGMVQSFCIATTVCGILVSIRLPSLLDSRRNIYLENYYFGGLASAVVCVLMTSGAFVICRKSKDIHFSIFLLYSGLIGISENTVINYFAANYELPRCGLDTILVALIGFFGFLGHCTITLAVQAEAAGVVSVLLASVNIIIAMIFQIIFFQMQPDVYIISGASLVITAVSIIGLRNWMLTLPEDSYTRKKFKFFLL